MATSSIRRISFRSMLTIAAATLVVMLPLQITWSGWSADLSVQTAAAKDGKGKGHGDDGDDGGKGGNGKSKGNSGTSSSVDDAAASPDQGDVQSVNPATGDRVTIRGKAIDILHSNGMRESVKGGRYLMTDDKGRTIVERAAKKSDLRRLRKLSG
jgi:hypothetical protein